MGFADMVIDVAQPASGAFYALGCVDGVLPPPVPVFLPFRVDQSACARVG